MAQQSDCSAIITAIKRLIIASVISGFSTCGFAEETNLGKMDYESSCAACHGENGKGDGAVKVELKTKPTDLTLLANNNGGVFPTDVLYQIIDGRRTVRAHGTFEMPVWGFEFQRSGSDDVTRNRILAIVAYLRSIQLK
jgi:mono/diheme cytochrome c family protein